MADVVCLLRTPAHCSDFYLPILKLQIFSQAPTVKESTDKPFPWVERLCGALSMDRDQIPSMLRHPEIPKVSRAKKKSVNNADGNFFL